MVTHSTTLSVVPFIAVIALDATLVAFYSHIYHKETSTVDQDCRMSCRHKASEGSREP